MKRHPSAQNAHNAQKSGPPRPHGSSAHSASCARQYTDGGTGRCSWGAKGSVPPQLGLFLEANAAPLYRRTSEPLLAQARGNPAAARR